MMLRLAWAISRNRKERELTVAVATLQHAHLVGAFLRHAWKSVIYNAI